MCLQTIFLCFDSINALNQNEASTIKFSLGSSFEGRQTSRIHFGLRTSCSCCVSSGSTSGCFATLCNGFLEIWSEKIGSKLNER
ncbi:unnamed protein product [Rodentolepis nana]|uniref:Secreted protein n=1 Tax=Rodentolepis nana TaxID=102285 RepID=A0A0R3T9Q1_RODNA|nr:unnamed protein product [Rodentolepis nana]